MDGLCCFKIPSGWAKKSHFWLAADVTGLGADDLGMGAVGFEADIRGVTGLGMEG